MTGLYAQGTSVAIEKSQMEISQTLRRYGAEGFAFGWLNDKASIGFVVNGRQVRFEVRMPLPAEHKNTPAGRTRNATQIAQAVEAEGRRKWRALALAIKAKLEVVASGIATFDEEFYANLVLPNGSTLYEHTAPELARIYATGRLPSPGSLLAIEAS